MVRNIIAIGNNRDVTDPDEDSNPSVSQDGMDLIKKIANIPAVSNRAYNPECNINNIVGMIRMLKHVDSRDSADRKDYFATLVMLTDCFDNGAIA